MGAGRRFIIMDSGSDSSVGLVAVMLILQLFLLLAFSIGGFYVLYCLNKAASGIDRMAAVAEAWLAYQTRIEANRDAVASVPGQVPAPEATTFSPQPSAPETPAAH